MAGDLEQFRERPKDEPERRVILLHFDVPSTMGIRALRRNILAKAGERNPEDEYKEKVHVSGVKSTEDGRFFARVTKHGSEVAIWKAASEYKKILGEHGVSEVITEIDLPPSMRKRLIEEKFIDG